MSKEHCNKYISKESNEILNTSDVMSIPLLKSITINCNNKRLNTFVGDSSTSG